MEHPVVPPRTPSRARCWKRAVGANHFGRAMVAVVAIACPLAAADLHPTLMARFTRQVQPLLLNKCAAGACHGGPAGHAPHLLRGDQAGQVDRTVTLANLDTLLTTVESGGGLPAFLKTISSRHPASATAAHRGMTPLTTVERTILERWLGAAIGPRAPAPTLAAPESAVPRSQTPAPTSAGLPPNRFRAMLEAAANPAPLPEPEPARGIILGSDGQ